MCNDKQTLNFNRDIHMQQECLPFWYLPDSLTVTCGEGTVTCPIRTEFRVGIVLRCLFSEPYYLSRPEKLTALAQRILFAEPEQLCGAEDTAILEAIVWYLSDGRMTRGAVHRRLQTGGGNRRGGSTRNTKLPCPAGEAAIFSYKWDMPALWAAFLAEYRIDLMREPYQRMHLWQFDALVRGLSPDSTVSRLAVLRSPTPEMLEDEGMRVRALADKLRFRIPSDKELNEMYNDTHLCERRTL